jgi:hypothetical protein
LYLNELYPADWADGGEWKKIPVFRAPGFTDVAVASPLPGLLAVFAVDGTGQVRRELLLHGRLADDGSENWPCVHGPEAGRVTAIAATSCAPHSQTLVAVADGDVHVRTWHDPVAGGSAGSWRNQAAGRQFTDVACASPQQGHLEVYALDSGGRIWTCRSLSRGADWTGWVSVDALTGIKSPAGHVAAITAADDGAGHGVLVAITAEGTIHVAHQVLDAGTGETLWPFWSPPMPPLDS